MTWVPDLMLYCADDGIINHSVIACDIFTNHDKVPINGVEIKTLKYFDYWKLINRKLKGEKCSCYFHRVECKAGLV